MDIDRAIAFSRYAERALTQSPELRGTLEQTLDAPFDWVEARAELERRVAGNDPTALAAALRILRRRVFLHTLLRDLTGRAPLVEVVGAVTALAECALRAAVTVHTRALAAVHGSPTGGETGAIQELVVIAMGKLGGGELNVSSDIDLVFAYPEEGETTWRSMNTKVGTLLVGLAPLLANVEGSAGKRLVVGPIAVESDARQLCGRMAKVGIACASVPFIGEPLPLTN
jgi:glutamine synthetase adenylyltransferase